MDSQNPQQRDYHSQPASRQDAQIATSSSGQHTSAYSEPPASYQAARMAAGALAGVAPLHAPLSPPDETEGGDEADDGPVTVPVLGIQPLQRIVDHGARGDIASQTGQTSQMVQGAYAPWPDDDDDTSHANDDDRIEDALNALDVDIALGFGTEPILRDDAFAFRERSWDTWRRTRKTLLTLLALAAMLVVAILGATFAASYMQGKTRGLNFTPSQPTVSSYSGGLVIQGPETIAPTPEAPKYQIGAWMSNNAPSGGSVKVFVRLTENIKPLAHVPVTLTAQVPGGTLRYGPTKTDAYGLAAFDVRFGGLSGTPVFVTATAKVNKQTTLTADTVFVPI